MTKSIRSLGYMFEQVMREVSSKQKYGEREGGNTARRITIRTEFQVNFYITHLLPKLINWDFLTLSTS